MNYFPLIRKCSDLNCRNFEQAEFQKVNTITLNLKPIASNAMILKQWKTDIEKVTEILHKVKSCN